MELENVFFYVVGAIVVFFGFIWKIWIINDGIKEVGGFYCFDSEIVLIVYVNSFIIIVLKVNFLLLMV